MRLQKAQEIDLQDKIFVIDSQGNIRLPREVFIRLRHFRRIPEIYEDSRESGQRYASDIYK